MGVRRASALANEETPERVVAGDGVLFLTKSMSTAKHDVKQLLNKLPDDCTVEDVQYHLYVLDKVRRGLEDAQANGTITHAEAESRLSQWLTE
jgi:hypothetical protein